MNSIKLAFLAMVGTVLTTSVHAQTYLLTVDITDPSAVVITATGNNATATDSTTTVYKGIDLLGFFTSAFLANNSLVGTPSGSLIGGGASSGYNYFDVDNASGSFIDLNPFIIFNPGDPDANPTQPTQSFSTTSPAFTGSMTLDLSAVIASMPTVGTTGNIQAGANTGGTGSANMGSIIGQWQVISVTPTPEPGTLALASLGGLSALALAWRRRK